MAGLSAGRSGGAGARGQRRPQLLDPHRDIPSVRDAGVGAGALDAVLFRHRLVAAVRGRQDELVVSGVPDERDPEAFLGLQDQPAAAPGHDVDLHRVPALLVRAPPHDALFPDVPVAPPGDGAAALHLVFGEVTPLDRLHARFGLHADVATSICGDPAYPCIKTSKVGVRYGNWAGLAAKGCESIVLRRSIACLASSQRLTLLRLQTQCCCGGGENLTDFAGLLSDHRGVAASSEFLLYYHDLVTQANCQCFVRLAEGAVNIMS